MNQSNKWDRPWEKHSFSYARKIHEQKKGWESDFIQSIIILSNVAFGCFFTYVLESTSKHIAFRKKEFKKHVSSFNQKEMESITRFYLFDYISELPETTLSSYNLDPEKVTKSLVDTLLSDEVDRSLFEEIKHKKTTYFPSSHLLRMMGAGSVSTDEGILVGIEELKTHFFDQYNRHLSSILKKHFE
ncbi:hypothetical protein IMZ31_21670 (plasmid) [Pontibacillus sp. ALD_SL1]|uniref:hypothetical protein n=1 Tax=Pontibacillus sp. ALD_SL1 TaxID=2777185 RepID=UPI001A9604C8|nr:hypothetical protein [Pontibacillus sp. ALD_SL1]QST02062.1 hypothetical protein IMZ31_21670 [Pontibacillus sp. ALD_SL1]